MKRSQPEPSSSVPPKKFMTKMIPTVSIGPCSTEDEMNMKVLKFQNKKLCERLEEMKAEEERLHEKLNSAKEQRTSDLEILSVINRHWIQLDEDVTTLLQRYEGCVPEELSDQNETAQSYLETLSQVSSGQVKEEVAKRAKSSRKCVEKILSYLEKAGALPKHLTKPEVTLVMNAEDTPANVAMDVEENQQEVVRKKAEESESASESTATEATPSEKAEVKSPVEQQSVATPPPIPDAYTILADNQRLREMMSAMQQKLQTTSLEFSEIRDKYALTSKEISGLNTQLQDSEYELQKANHRVENLVKRLNEQEAFVKKLREGEMPKEATGLGDQSEEKDVELEEQRELAETRLSELQKLKEDLVASQQEVEKLRLEVVQIPESVITQSAPYKCIQSQFSVLHGEATQMRQQLDEIRKALSLSKTQHAVQLEQIESDIMATHKKYKSEVNELHDALLLGKREYDLMRIEYEQSAKTNEQTGPMIKEMTYMNNSLQSYNKQLKGEVNRYKRKLGEAQNHIQKIQEELSSLKEKEKSKISAIEEPYNPQDTETTKKKQDMDMNEEGGVEGSATPKEKTEDGEEGELEEGEEQPASSAPSGDADKIKELQANLKKAQESQKEMKLLLDVYKGAAKDLRDKVELLASEKALKEEIDSIKTRVEGLEQELEKHKGAMADEEAIRRLKMAEETIENLQKNLAATKQEEAALLAEMEFTGQEYEEMQEQNVRLLQQLREKDDANLKLMSERIKSNQIQKQIREEKDVLADHVTSLNGYREAQCQLVKKQEERERALQNAVTAMEKELNLRQQTMDLLKRKAVESAQNAQDLKIRLDALQQQLQEAQDGLNEKTRCVEEEAFRAKRVQEECVSLKRKLEKQKKIDLYGAADEVLLEEVRQYKARLTCPCCNTRKKDAILTKCFHVFCYECLKTRYDTRQRKCPKCNATFGSNDFHKMYL
ncbi:E3 ubiquitin-protein ligase BRE1B isoform X2 [Nematostella vectensis]|uniref:E3 ubiquitin-protein ligase BRE1B isoform X2 n=1 Tax=Nematostella vectensis TaxID=45351 RepID=UPI0020779364|nr:E3 ubiquitin-protein ligase BRE1B isoform X2 [Nematostella vectensis]